MALLLLKNCYSLIAFLNDELMLKMNIGQNVLTINGDTVIDVVL